MTASKTGSVTPAELRRVLERQLGALKCRIVRLPSGGLDVRALSDRFGQAEDARGILEAALAAESRALPVGSMLWLRAPDDVDDEDQALFERVRVTRPTWGDALLWEPRESLGDDRGFAGCRVIAFWGIKGGVGRTTALAHVASILGQRRRVLAVDLDLDSPGLVATLCDTGDPDTGGRFDDALVQAADDRLADEDLASSVGAAIRSARNENGSNVWVLGAAAADEPFVQKLLGPLTPTALYRSSVVPLRRVLRLAIARVSAEYLLIDARSGYCDESAMAVLDLADDVVVFASPARTTFPSISPAIVALERARQCRGRPERVRFVASMLPSDDGIARAIRDDLLTTAEEARADVAGVLETEPENLPGDVEVLGIEYRPRIVENEGRLMHGIIDGYRDLAERMDPREVPSVVGVVEPSFVASILREVEIPNPQAEDESSLQRLEQLFTVTSKLRDFARHEVTLVLGAKGTGKSFLRRMCVRNRDLLAKRSGMSSLSHTDFLDVYAGERANDAAPRIDGAILQQLDAERPHWASLWSAIALVRITSQKANLGAKLLTMKSSGLVKSLRNALDATLASDITTSLLKLAREPDLSSAWESLDLACAQSDLTIALVFDQLDIALGTASGKNPRRLAMIKGLLETSLIWRDRRHLTAKIFLREDLWNQADMEEKAKYATRSITLVWSPEEIWRLCIRAFAVGSKLFRTHVEQRFGIELERLEESSESQQLSALAVIWGERMGGSESDTYSTSWAYRRLHDGNARLFPRAALWLLHFAVEAERNRGARVELPLLSPDSLRSAMSRVASLRLEELRNEAPEHRKLLTALKGFVSYWDESKFIASLQRNSKFKLKDARAAIEQLVKIGVLERGSRRRGQPTLRIVDLYAFAPELEVNRLGRR
jgi:MinD-like ATPase involved in chromosome partitioning or flagellar assembly